MKWSFLVLMISSLGFSISYGQESEWIDPTADEFFFVDAAQLDSGGVFAFWGIYFQLGRSALVDTANSQFNREFDIQIMRSNETRLLGLANYMLHNPTYIFELGVHRDCRGSEASSTRLTPKRAQTIVAELVKLGVSEERLIARGFGESEPYIDNGIVLTCDYILSRAAVERDALHQKNRRFQLKVLSKKYIPQIAELNSVLDRGETFVSYDFLFDFMTDQLRDTNSLHLLAILEYMKHYPSCILEIGVHSDCRASKAMSTNLSKNRANAICDELVKLGIEACRINAIGYQGSVPLVEDGIELNCEYIMQQVPEKAELLYQKSRRVEIKVLSKSYVDD